MPCHLFSVADPLRALLLPVLPLWWASLLRICMALGVLCLRRLWLTLHCANKMLLPWPTASQCAWCCHGPSAYSSSLFFTGSCTMGAQDTWLFMMGGGIKHFSRQTENAWYLHGRRMWCGKHPNMPPIRDCVLIHAHCCLAAASSVTHPVSTSSMLSHPSCAGLTSMIRPRHGSGTREINRLPFPAIMATWAITWHLPLFCGAPFLFMGPMLSFQLLLVRLCMLDICMHHAQIVSLNFWIVGNFSWAR